MTRSISLALALVATFAACSPASAAPSGNEGCASAETAQAKPKKKRGFGLGSLLKAANQAGVGNMLGYGGMLGTSQAGQVAGAIAGTAVNAAAGSADPQGAVSQIGGLMGGHRVAQVAGAITGTAANLARSAPGASDRAPAPSCAAAALRFDEPFKALTRLEARIDRSAPGRDGLTEVFVTFRNNGHDKEAVNAAAQRMMGPDAQGSFVTARYALYPAAGERSDSHALPVPHWVGPGAEVQVRYVFEASPTGTLTITDGTATQKFTPAS